MFQNLDFESANLPSLPADQSGGYVPISQAMPAWSGYLGAASVSQVFQNNLSTGSAAIDLFGPDYRVGPGRIIDGHYTAVLQAGGSGTHVAATLSQSGLVPVGSSSLQMKVGTGDTGFTVSLGGQSLSMSPLLTTPVYTVYGGNLPPALAGQFVGLSISAVPIPTDPFNGITLDDITFSSSPVPEPNVAWLVIAGGAALRIADRLRGRSQRRATSKAFAGTGRSVCSIP